MVRRELCIERQRQLLFAFSREPTVEDMHSSACGQLFIGLAYLSRTQAQPLTDLFHIIHNRSGFVSELTLSKLLCLTRDDIHGDCSHG
jgi:hypothetical protein